MDKAQIELLDQNRRAIKRIVSGHLSLIFNELEDMNPKEKAMFAMFRDLVEYPFKDGESKELKDEFKNVKPHEFEEVFVEEFNRVFLKRIAQFHNKSKKEIDQDPFSLNDDNQN